jgi:hypothetical protein
MHHRKLLGLLCTALVALVLSKSVAAQSTPVSSPRPQAASSAADPFERFVHFLWQDWTGTAPASATTPPRRGLPSPLDSPPFYSSDWSYSDSPTIGEPDTAPYALSTALHLENSRTKLYGWVEPSVNVSTSADSNSPEADDFLPNRVVLDRFVLIAERLPDTVQRDHVDWGFRFTNLFGTDYRFNVGKGYFLSQLTDHNRQYGYDAPFDWIDVYLPAAQGINLRFGRFASAPGIESQIPPFNYAFSHSLVNITEPVTQTGVMATAKLSDQWLVQLGLTGGNDIALWSKGAKPSVTACIDHTTGSVNDNFYVCANGINDGKYAYNNVQQYDATWYRKWSKRVHTAAESWFMYQRDVPSTLSPFAPEPNSYAALCHPGLARCFAPEYATLIYAQAELSPHNTLSLRNEFLNDKRGQRTGIASRYTEHTLSWTHWIGSTVQIRPEIRYERSWDRPAYNNGIRFAQFTAAADLVLHY